MKRNTQCLLFWRLSILGILTLPAMVGQSSPNSEAAIHVSTDWSHRHLIFSGPATAEQAKRVRQDPRYWQQLARRSRASLREPETGGTVGSVSLLGSSEKLRSRNREIKRDWAQNMGSGASGGAGNYPAKFSFSITQANCANAAQPDFVVYSTGLSGSTSQASIVAYDNLYSGCNGINLGTAANFAMLAAATITNTGATVVTGGISGFLPARASPVLGQECLRLLRQSSSEIRSRAKRKPMPILLTKSSP
jgi:hypothetical protein